MAEYLAALATTRGTGEAVAETSYYGALQQLLNHIGQSLAPNVFANQHPRNRGAGIADMGLFSAEQIGSASGDTSPWQRQVPSRGVVEAKGPKENIYEIATSTQVTRYSKRYGQVLVTNLRSFVVATYQSNGSIQIGEPLELAASEPEFWKLVDAPAQVSRETAEALEVFLRDALSRAAPITSSESLAWFLAAYARLALHRVEEKGLGELASVRQNLQQALGVTYTGDRAERFFRSTLVQTLFYGIFSVWVLWNRERSPDDTATFDWRLAGWELDVPVIGELFDRIAQPSGIQRLKLSELLDLAGRALNRVDRDKFFEQFELDHAIEYFYEPFLSAFDPDLRKELGVWYTPTEVVRYMTARVQSQLRDRLGIEDGLADSRVTLLDPCVGTGSFLLEAAARIHATLKERDPADSLVAADVRDAVATRLIGFELLPAPFVVAHLQLGLLLRRIGAPLDLAHNSNSRAAVYLTNSLTRWSPMDDEPQGLFPGLAAEREAADEVKRRDEILVVIGNPPYNAFAGVSPNEEGDLIEPYKHGVATRNTLDDLYVRFIRVAERRIAEMSGVGIVCLVTNSSFLARPSFRFMRKSLAQSFDYIHVDNLNGDRDESHKKTPLGRADPSVFSTKRNTAGIAEGVCITTLVRLPDHKDTLEKFAEVTYRDFWGKTKRSDLLAAAEGHQPEDDETDTAPVPVEVRAETLWSFKPIISGSSYYTWPRLSDLAAKPPTYGMHEARGAA